ncbi:hypothetical protein IY145_24990 [Methylosinus sp. H3A]|uniref:ribbon-helix-helix domain-containing protein n=1 Tax=Methylosinus sp. H3A TaxID=2785786 RepID=UPI0018C22CE7|nr:ribbon-helix-helix domain-containing protein [Methylosinus sp. H3A]MBG0807843.1 hypothetical protein [Methylosinus sp. H3A]MBG0807865.1 hypothetical protein [Methylosinus sp. H3A]MBG0812583.1 hypothetical protein [Methylosinus sp. H3A]
MSKFGAIQQQLEKASRTKPAAVAPVAKPQPVPPPAIEPAPEPQAAAPAPAPAAARYKAPSREGKTHIGAYLTPDFKRSMRLVQAETGEDTTQLIARALNELFRAHKVPVVDQD